MPDVHVAQLAVPETAWKLALASGKAANHGNFAKAEPITFNSRSTISDADQVNSSGMFSS